MIFRLVYFTELMAFFYVLSLVFGQRLDFNVKTTVTILINLTIVTIANEGIVPISCIGFMYIVSLIYVFIEYNGGAIKKIMYFFFAIVIVLAMQLLLSGIVVQVFTGKVGEAEQALMVNIMAIACVLFIRKAIKRIRWNDFVDTLIRYRSVVIIFIAQVVILLLSVKVKKQIDLFYGLGIISFSAAISVLVWNLFYERSKIENMKKENYIAQLYNNEFEKMIADIRTKQHNYDNHINALAGLSHNGHEETEEIIEEYRREIKKENRFVRILQCNSSPIIIGFLYNKFCDAERRNIQIEEHIVIEHAECKLSQYKIIEILGILIDNALEDTEKRDDRRIVYFEMLERKDNVEITIKNYHEYVKNKQIEKFFEEGYSTKGPGRGIGLSYVKKSVYEARGQIIAENEKDGENNMFAVRIMIPK